MTEFSFTQEKGFEKLMEVYFGDLHTIYYKPYISKVLNISLTYSDYELIDWCCENLGGEYLPSAVMLLNQVGLSTQVPMHHNLLANEHYLEQLNPMLSSTKLTFTEQFDEVKLLHRVIKGEYGE